MIPISVIITTRNEADNLPRCLEALSQFDEVIVVDSNSRDKTCDIALQYDAQVISFDWNGQYPKKRQWCLNNLNLKNDHIFFVDADEVVTRNVVEEIKKLSLQCAGYFVKSKYSWQDKILKHGLQNNKLVLFDRTKIEFPIIDDLDIDGMGEMEGHYQPILKEEFQSERLGHLKYAMLHYAYSDEVSWNKRHERYAQWEAVMIKRDGYPKDPSIFRETLKRFFRQAPLRVVIAFVHCYIIKIGFLDGRAGFEFARSRMFYYQMVNDKLKNICATSNKVVH